jgi:hypothetical protein
MNKKYIFLLLIFLLFHTNISNAKEDTINLSYLPISVGNYWKYKCSSEGEFLFKKEIKVTKKLKNKLQTYYQLALKTDGDAKILKSFVWLNKEGNLLSSYQSTLKSPEIIMIKNPSIGSIIGKNKVFEAEWIQTPATDRIKTIKIKNIPDSKIEGDFEIANFKNYAKNIGLISEADSLGGECELIDYKINNKIN